MSEHIIKVVNVAPIVTESVLKAFFQHIGPIKRINLYSSSISGSTTKEALVQFENNQDAVIACTYLNHTRLGPYDIKLDTSSGFPEDVSVDSEGISTLPTSTHLTTTHPHGAPGGPMAESKQQEEAARTVYVGNLSPSTTEADVLLFCAKIGPVSFCKLAGDMTQPSRYCFVEFADMSAADAAMNLTGAIICDRPIKVNRSNNSVVKPTRKPTNPHLEGIVYKSKRAIDAISAIILGTKSIDDNEDDKDHDRKRHRRSHHRSSRSRSRRRSRSRSPGRHRSSRHRSKYSRDRHSRHHF